ncbi:MAG: AMP-binding protein [Actinobacteria bacterium]|nr:AMP-binding protein [Actinomycetota bacterium]
MDPLLPIAETPASRPALIAPEGELSYGRLDTLSAGLAAELRPGARVAVFATATIETCVAVVAALRAGAVVVPVNPRAGSAELDHLLADSGPELVLQAAGAELPAALAARPRREVGLDRGSGRAPGEAEAGALPEPPPEAPALVLYTSGTTGPPKGAVISRAAVAADLDGLARAWEWTAADVVAQALPLYHAHGLVLGVLGPLRLGGGAMLLGRFDPDAVTAALRGPATMLFGVPTMYRRLRLAAEERPEVAAALGSARLLVSGSAALPAAEHAALERLTGRRVVERYGMTETLITVAARSDGPRRAGSVGLPVPGIEVRLVGEDGGELGAGDPEALGELQVRGPTLFDGYLNQPEASAKTFDGEWFRTGDIATRDPDGGLRIVGRRSGDLIKTGGYRVGAGEVEAALLEHPAVAEVAVTGAPDPDLGERIVAWVVAAGPEPPRPEQLTDHTTALLSPHKRPREFRFLEALPRNALGKVQKSRLGE